MPQAKKTKKEKLIRRFLRNKIILITGGTGSFGNTTTKKLLSMNPKKIIIFSRDETKQFFMRNYFNNDKRLEFFIGDIRNRSSVDDAMKGVDYVFHAAALKQVPSCEFFPLEAVKTNILGGSNVINSAIDNNVKRMVILSTDKAVYPINAMGMTKALLEKLMIAKAIKKGKTILCGVRYGNVMYSRGSVIPYFIDQIKQGLPLTVTNKNMTRFLLSLDNAIDLVLHTLIYGDHGTIAVRKAPACTIETLARALIKLYSYKKGIKEIGIRPGEKMHETLVTSEELRRSFDRGQYYQINPEFLSLNYEKFYTQGQKPRHFLDEGYTSANTQRLNLEETIKLLLTLEEIKNEFKTKSLVKKKKGTR